MVPPGVRRRVRGRAGAAGLRSVAWILAWTVGSTALVASSAQGAESRSVDVHTVALIDRSPSMASAWDEVRHQVLRLCEEGGSARDGVHLWFFPAPGERTGWQELTCDLVASAFTDGDALRPEVRGDSLIDTVVGAAVDRYAGNRPDTRFLLLSDGQVWRRDGGYTRALTLPAYDPLDGVPRRTFCDALPSRVWRWTRVEGWERRELAACVEGSPQSGPPLAAPAPAGSRRSSGRRSHREVVAVGRAGRFHCSGVLVSPTRVVTARHCLPVDAILVGLSVSAPEKVIAVADSLVPPEPQLDLAVLRLATPTSVPPAYLDLDREPEAPVDVRTVGFGASSRHGRFGYGTRRAYDATVPGWGCTPSRAPRAGCDPDREMLVVGVGGIDTCDGDSGGPLYARRPGGWELVAITSRPVGWARIRCGDGGIYVRLAAAATWLRGALDLDE